MKELARKFLSTKFITTIIVGMILLAVFIILVNKEIMDSTIFIAWLGGLLGNFGIYTAGNVVSKKYRPD